MNRPLAVPLTWPEQPLRASTMPQAAATRNAFISSLPAEKNRFYKKTRPAEAGLVWTSFPKLSAFGDHRIAHQVRVAHVLDQLLHVLRGFGSKPAHDEDSDHRYRQAEHAGRHRTQAEPERHVDAEERVARNHVVHANPKPRGHTDDRSPLAGA